MRDRTQLIVGAALVFFGAVILVGNIFRIDMSRICWPSLLILAGLWLLLAPRWLPEGVRVRLLGGLTRVGAWAVEGQEVWTFVGDVYLDFSQAEIPNGESRFRVNAFVGDIDVIVPPDVGVKLTSSGVVSEVRFFGKKQSQVLGPVRMQTDGFDQAAKQVTIDLACFVADVSVRAA